MTRRRPRSSSVCGPESLAFADRKLGVAGEAWVVVGELAAQEDTAFAGFHPPGMAATVAEALHPARMTDDAPSW
jgi:hypothetical protein